MVANFPAELSHAWRYSTKHGYINDKGVRNRNKLKPKVRKFQGHIPRGGG